MSEEEKAAEIERVKEKLSQYEPESPAYQMYREVLDRLQPPKVQKTQNVCVSCEG